jgi:CBS domain-containing protein
MKIRDAMTRKVQTVAPGTAIREAVHALATHDIGALPVVSGEMLAGMVTDRDIALRALEKGPDAPVAEIMSTDIVSCRDDDEVDSVCKIMADAQVRRLPVVDSEKRLIGIFSLADVARTASRDNVSEALGGITRPGGLHTQMLNGRA